MNLSRVVSIRLYTVCLAYRRSPNGGCQGFFRSTKNKERHDDGREPSPPPTYRLAPINQSCTLTRWDRARRESHSSNIGVPFLWRGSPPSSAFALVLAANEPCLFNKKGSPQRFYSACAGREKPARKRPHRRLDGWQLGNKTRQRLKMSAPSSEHWPTNNPTGAGR